MCVHRSCVIYNGTTNTHTYTPTLCLCVSLSNVFDKIVKKESKKRQKNDFVFIKKERKHPTTSSVTIVLKNTLKNLQSKNIMNFYIKKRISSTIFYRDDRNFQLRNTYAATLNTTNITINAAMSNLKSASNMSSSSSVVSGDLK